jgi:predicted component of type VI protein secretion system
MARLIITHQGTVIKEYDLSKETTTVGRKPENDIVLDDPTVSGVHASFLHMQHTYVEDLNSTNGIKLNGKTINKRQLNHGDLVQIGQHEFKFIDDAVQDFEQTVVITPQVQPAKAEKKPVTASVVITQGPKQGEAIALNKPYTKLGSASHVAVIARRGESYYLMPMSGGTPGESPKLNGKQIGAESMLLSHGDQIEVASTQLQFKLEQ